MADCKANVLLTCSGVMRGVKPIELKKIVDKGLDMCSQNLGHTVSERLSCSAEGVLSFYFVWN